MKGEVTIQSAIDELSRMFKFLNAHYFGGILVEKSPQSGWCITTPSPEFTALVKKHCRAGCFKLERIKTYRDGTPKTTTVGPDGREKTISRTKQSSRKYICPACAMAVRATKEVNLICGDCRIPLIHYPKSAT